MADPVRLTSTQVASFVANGYLRFDEIVAPEVSAAALAELANGFEPTLYQPPIGGPTGRPVPGTPLDALWRGSSTIGSIMRLPRVAGLIQSLLGPRALYDHHYSHVVPAGQRWSQPWHADAIIDPRTFAFDIQLFFFFHDTPREAGGTMILPGSHLRKVNESDIGRTQNFRGQLPTICRGGTLLVCHHGIWHCGQPNHTQSPRTMFKLRLGASSPQRRGWDCHDIDDPAVTRLLQTEQAWMGSADARLEIVNRIRLWRYLTGNDRFDIDYWLTRIETPRPVSRDLAP